MEVLSECFWVHSEVGVDHVQKMRTKEEELRVRGERKWCKTVM